MGELHAKFHQNWWSGFRDIALHDTEGHSFIIIRILHHKKKHKTLLNLIYDQLKKADIRWASIF